MNKGIDREQLRAVVEERVADYLNRAYNSLCEQYGVDDFDWFDPHADDSMVAEQDLGYAWTQALASAIDWNTDTERED